MFYIFESLPQKSLLKSQNNLRVPLNSLGNLVNSVYDLSLMNTGTHLQKLEKESKAEKSATCLRSGGLKVVMKSNQLFLSNL